MSQEVTENKVDQAPKEEPQEVLPRRNVLVRYGKVGLVAQFRHNERTLPSVRTHVVVQTDRGLEMGEVISPSAAHRGCACIIPKEKIDSYISQSGGADYPFSRNGRVSGWPPSRILMSSGISSRISVRKPIAARR